MKLSHHSDKKESSLISMRAKFPHLCAFVIVSHMNIYCFVVGLINNLGVSAIVFQFTVFRI